MKVIMYETSVQCDALYVKINNKMNNISIFSQHLDVITPNELW